MGEITKYDTEGNVIELIESDREDIIKWETIAKEAVDDAIREHEKGMPTAPFKPSNSALH
jgi:hypothetical protein